MKKIIFIIAIIMSVSVTSEASVRQFIRTCGWGVVIGATAGLASLAMVNNPEDNLGNIAKGASLGLYGGIAYGLYQHNLEQQQEMNSLVIAPKIHEQKIEGVQFSSIVWDF